MSRVAAAVAASLAVLLAGCGTPSADLFVVERTGDLPDAGLDLVVGDGGTVRCDGAERTIASERLLEARALAEDLQPLLDRGLRLPPGDGALLRYRVVGEAGTVTFSDASPGLPPELGRVVRFTRAVATEACGRDR